MILSSWHWVNPYSRPVRIAVLVFVIFHAAAGVHVMLTDVGFAVRWHHCLVWMLAGIGLIIFLYVTSRYSGGGHVRRPHDRTDAAPCSSLLLDGGRT
jgi:hypothetical protein